MQLSHGITHNSHTDGLVVLRTQACWGTTRPLHNDPLLLLLVNRLLLPCSCWAGLSMGDRQPVMGVMHHCRATPWHWAGQEARGERAGRVKVVSMMGVCHLCAASPIHFNVLCQSLARKLHAGRRAAGPPGVEMLISGPERCVLCSCVRVWAAPSDWPTPQQLD